MSFGALFFGKITAFHQFGLVGGVGIFFCWGLSYTLLPALALLLERVRPTSRARFKAWQYPRFLALVPIRWPELVLALGLSLSLAANWQVRRFLPDCLETDLSKLRNQALDGSDLQKLDNRVADIYQRSMTPLFMLARDREQARRICDYFNGMVARLG